MVDKAKPVSVAPFILGELAFALVALPIYIVFVIPDDTPSVLPGLLPVYNVEIGLLVCAVLSVVALVLSLLLFKAAMRCVGLERLITPEVKEFAATFTLPQTALIYLAAGIGEEFLFRGVCLELGGLFVASALFTLVHIAYWKQPVLLAMVFVLALLLGGLYLVTDSLLMCILVHFAYNFLVTKQAMPLLTEIDKS